MSLTTPSRWAGRGLFLLALFAVSHFLAPRAAAQALLPAMPPRAGTEPTEADQARGKAAYDAVKEALHRDDNRAALSAAQIAWAAIPNASTAIVLAVVNERLDRPRRAYELLLLASDLGPSDTEARFIAAGLERLGPTLNPPMGHVVVTPEPGDAAATVGGVDVRGARTFALPVGTHTVRVRAAGHDERSVAIGVQAGRPHTVTVSLRPTPIAPAPSVVLATDPARYQPASPIAGITVTTLGLATIAGGAVAHVLAFRAKQDADDLAVPDGTADRQTRYDDAIDRLETSETVAWVLYGVGGAALITGVVLWAVNPQPDPQQANNALVVSPGWIPGGATLHLSGSF